MKKTILIVLTLILMTSTQVFATSETDDNNYRNGSYDCVGHINEHDITHITHHTCGYGGTSCEMCYLDSETYSCGCVTYYYKCCCGSVILIKESYCSTHP